MTFFFRLRRAAGGHNGRKNKISRPDDSPGDLTTPSNFICPVSLDLMKDPVTLSTGITYDRESIERWLEVGNRTCPLTNQILETYDLIPNHSIRRMIQDWCVDNKSYGLERIPTPRVPVGPSQISAICAAIDAATRAGDSTRCRDLVGKIKVWGRESERNKMCIRDDGAAGVAISACFEFFAGASKENHSDLLRDLLSVLTWMFPLREEGKSTLGSKTSLQCMAWFLNGGDEDIPANQNALLVLKELISSDQRYANALMEVDQSLPKSLLKMVKLPSYPSANTATKASLTIMHHMIVEVPHRKPSDRNVISELVHAGLVAVLLELLVDADKSVCEKALTVLDAVCSCQEGREKAYGHPLTMPLLVKKMMRVSELGTEHCISAMWKLCKGEDERAAAIEALELGAFQKLLVVLQVGCGEKAKEKATELLKMMNVYKNRVTECLDSSNGFMYLKRSY
ncbi:unnamed protein product [Cuscuta europaea]|uniref:U-box domain-containing protein n=1 Tax=Cuscuta europaea TaxID=41803 RepID=A0A9P1EGW7_CUSEU|nr:unnamed protein product [Cuscuta europaea]